MGGNVFKDTRRISTEEAFETIEEVKELLYGYKVDYIPWYTNKQDHGDIDFIVEPKATPEVLKNKFKNYQIVNNSYISSIQYKGIQLDFIRTPSEYYDFAYHYYAYNDLGNLIGRITRNLGFKFGFKGLFYLFRPEENYPEQDIKVNVNFLEALGLFGFSTKKYKEGFNALEDIFEYVYDSAYFDSSLFLLENLDGPNRRRNQKRKTYMSFLVWLKDKPTLTLPDIRYLKELVMEDVCTDDKYLQPKISQAIKKHDDFVSYKQKFNSRIVSECTGLETVELGKAMKQLKCYLTQENVLSMTDQQIMTFIKDFNYGSSTKASD